MIHRKSKDTFWTVVEQCLVQFHGLPEAEAREKARDLRRHIDEPPTGMSSEIFYHAEPFDVACDIADSSLDFSTCREPYNLILKKHHW